MFVFQCKAEIQRIKRYVIPNFQILIVDYSAFIVLEFNVHLPHNVYLKKLVSNILLQIMRF
jgi:hypothetical protein